MSCAIDGCEAEPLARGLCKYHYNQWWWTNAQPCAEPGCARWVASRDRCNAHHQPANRGTCSIDGCERPVKARGWCGTHHQRWRLTGSTADPIKATRVERFWSHFEREPGGCWLWTGYLDRDGYGKFGRFRSARFSYAFLVAPIPDRYEVDHLCRNRSCVNPSHLEAVPQRENWRRGQSPSQLAAQKTHCKHGHEFTPENTQIRKNGNRACKECMRVRKRAHRERAKK